MAIEIKEYVGPNNIKFVEVPNAKKKPAKKAATPTAKKTPKKSTKK